MKVSRMKLCSAFVINYPFLLRFQQYKGLRFSKLTLSQMGNKTERHTQNCLWYYFFHLISIPCIHAAGRPSALLRIPPPCCFFVGVFSPPKKRPLQQLQVHDYCKIRQSYSFLSFFPQMKLPLLSSTFWSIFSLFFASAKAHQQWLSMPPIFPVC